MTLLKINHFSAKINSLKERLLQLQQVVLRDYPQLHESIPSTDGINIKKLGQHGLIMTNSCNAAQKARRLLQHKIGGTVFELDCHHHLRNVWIQGMEKLISVYLQVVVSDSLENIAPELRVTCIFLAIARAWDIFLASTETMGALRGVVEGEKARISTISCCGCARFEA